MKKTLLLISSSSLFIFFGCKDPDLPAQPQSITAPIVEETPQSSTKIISLDDFHRSAFCANFGCQEDSSWALKTGGWNHTYFVRDPGAGITLEASTDGNDVTGFGLTFYDRSRLSASEFALIDSLISSIDESLSHEKSKHFVKKNIEKRVPEISRAPSITDGRFRISAGKVGDSQVLSVEK